MGLDPGLEAEVDRVEVPPQGGDSVLDTMQRNIDAFAFRGIKTVMTMCAGCGMTLKNDYETPFEVLDIKGPIYTMGGACASGNIALRSLAPDVARLETLAERYPKDLCACSTLGLLATYYEQDPARTIRWSSAIMTLSCFICKSSS